VSDNRAEGNQGSAPSEIEAFITRWSDSGAALPIHPLLLIVASGVIAILGVVFRYHVALTTDYPLRAKHRKAMRDIVFRLRADDDDPEIIEDHIIPLLRSHFQLGEDASPEDIADHIKAEHPHLAADVKAHAKAKARGTQLRPDPQSLANHLSRIPF
jgi:hypothetical protein